MPINFDVFEAFFPIQDALVHRHLLGKKGKVVRLSNYLFIEGEFLKSD
jgi:hypothetical protein